MIEVRITKWMLEKAIHLATIDKVKYGNYNCDPHIISDKTRVTGKLGEVVISCYFNTKLSNTTDYDIIINQQYVEIKTNSINVDTIKPYFECNVFKPSIGCDRYMFVFVHSSLSIAWIVGTCSREEFETKSFYNCPSSIKGRGNSQFHHIKIEDLEDVETWQ